MAYNRITRKLDLDDLVVVLIDRRCPTQACTSSRTSSLLCVPINVEMTGIKALLLFGLPMAGFPKSTFGSDVIHLRYSGMVFSFFNMLSSFFIISCNASRMLSAGMLLFGNQGAG